MPGNLNKPLKEFERLIKSDSINIQKNPVTKWMIQNVIININKFGNYSLDKANRSNKIDGVAAMINAYGGLLTSPIYSFEIY